MVLQDTEHDRIERGAGEKETTHLVNYCTVMFSWAENIDIIT